MKRHRTKQPSPSTEKPSKVGLPLSSTNDPRWFSVAIDDQPIQLENGASKTTSDNNADTKSGSLLGSRIWSLAVIPFRGDPTALTILLVVTKCKKAANERRGIETSPRLLSDFKCSRINLPLLVRAQYFTFQIIVRITRSYSKQRSGRLIIF